MLARLSALLSRLAAWMVTSPVAFLAAGVIDLLAYGLAAQRERRAGRR